ncbi:FtsK/SpoIIIE domain-containing protein [Pleionea litopenaei]|uniref:FtsK/SpoIIIE domain-containing protein n=1 Tax=Pleionea litopenaei TaxID=3070815 RepID=A0AA51RQI9_9GAMM|nr:FtsK/SpoIIIE domain-containing protein [Pleionea sp. HL-JVS1]WMS85624.1 FtsK/SpoIIIE domain-containing protein [Pleionea sp. HL-JVS1]
MNRNNLISAVALSYISEQLSRDAEGTVRFCMVGLEDSLVTAIAEAANNNQQLASLIEIKVSEVFDRNSTLPAELLSNESITHWRHCKLPDGKRGVLFAASQEELQRNDKSVEKITKIETDTLRSEYDSWIEKSGITSQILNDRKRAHLKTALISANETHAARTIETYADFVLSISIGILDQGLPLQKAVDNALPSLKLPRNSGYFDRISDAKRDHLIEWNKIFRRLHTRIRPLLVHENEKGEAISDQLSKNFEEIKDRFSPDEQQIISDFIAADLTPDEWLDTQQNLVALDWLSISDLFDGVTRTQALPLGDKTKQFFEDEFDDPLQAEEIDLLSATFPKIPSDDLQEFYESYREHLSRDKNLSSSWEKYIYRNPQTYSNFLTGLIDTTHRLREKNRDVKLSAPTLKLSIPNSEKKSFWKGKNPKVARYFAFRYHGLSNLLAPNIELDFGKLDQFYFPEISDEGLAKVTSGSKDARTLKFEAVLDPDGIASKLVFYWEMPVDAIATALPDDLISLANNNDESGLLATADITRQTVSTKGNVQRISLEDINTIRDVNNSNDGRLVAPNRESGNRAETIINEINALNAWLSKQQVDSIVAAFDTFRMQYTTAIRSWISEDGIGSESLVTQAETFGELLNKLLSEANKDMARERLWKELFRIGVADIGAGSPASIITPWHPLRLAEISVKAHQCSSLLKQVLQADESAIERADLLFGQVQLELSEDYYPEVCLGFCNEQSILLSSADTVFDYTLCESPVTGVDNNGNTSLDVDPDIAAKAFGKVGEQYLNLLPHERSNFSLVLYNAESKALPGALASELSSKVEKENELQCDLLLTHSRPKQMRRIYEQQNVAVSEESGSVMASEAARNFLSRLRVGFLDAALVENQDETARLTDIVALQDVVSRNAKLVWKPAPGDRSPTFLENTPVRWSRRRPVGPADTSTSVYLAAPSQPRAGQLYLNALHSYLYGDNALSGDVIPAREVNFRDGEVANIFDETHKIGEWVVNFDELVDRRLLSNNDIHVIRHIHERTINRNIIVSTTSQPRLLRALLNERLNRLDPDILGSDPDTVLNDLINRANKLSGQVVMRAARYGHYANELLGIVLSMREIENSLGDSEFPTGWYFLDDFASWFGQKEEQIADIMAISPKIIDGEHCLLVCVSEAKYVTSNGYKSHAKKSAKQLEETVARISRALDPDRNRIDRDIWLHRLGDFMLEGMEPFSSHVTGGWDLHRWSDEVRQDNVQIRVSGFSHVFVHDDLEYVDAGDYVPLKGMEHCQQKVFDKPRVAAAFRALVQGTNGESNSSKDPVVHLSSKINVAHENQKTDLKTQSDDVKSNTNPEVVESNSGQTEVSEDLGNNTTTTSAQGDPETPEESTEVNISNHQWPSDAVANWVNSGRDLDENDPESQQWLKHTVSQLQKALRGYDMTAEFVDARLTPNAALVRLRGSDDLTVPKVEKKRQELLTSHAIDVINVLAAPMEVIIMVKRPRRTILGLKDLWKQRELPESAPFSNMSLLLGACESDGQILYLNVGNDFGGFQHHGPHTLIAGETGSGKGVLVQSLLLDICATNSPENARIRMIDPKAGIDFPWLRNMPHLDGELITDRDQAVTALEELVAEMERRNHLLAEAGVTKLDQFNKKVPPEERLPRIWLFHDELADWMMISDYRDAVELNANRLGVKARAAGINLILVTQRPDKDALPMQLRANLTNRLVLKVADKRNSILVLDEPGAERLLGRGHLAAKLSGEGKIILAQVPFIHEDEIFDLAEKVRLAWIN